MKDRMRPLGGLALAAALAAVAWLAIEAPTGGAPDAPTRSAGQAPDAAAQAAGEPGAKPASAPTPVAAVDTAPGAIVGRVASGSPAVPDVGRRVVLLRTDGRSRWTTTDTIGEFAFDGVEPGVAHEVVVEAEGFGPERIAGVAIVARQRRDVGTFLLLPPGRFDVVVTDDRGAPIEGALVEAYRSPESYSTRAPLGSITDRLDAGAALRPSVLGRTDAKGRVTLAVASEPFWTIVASAPGRARVAEARTHVWRNTNERTVEMALPAAEKLKGTVRDTAGRPVASALVAARAEPPVAPGEHGMRSESGALWQRTTADAEGRFAFDALPPDDIELMACAPGGTPVEVATVAVPEIREADLVLPGTATMSGRVTDADTGAGIPGATVTAGVGGSGWERRPFARLVTTDADGGFVLDGLPPRTELEVACSPPPSWVFEETRGDLPGALGEGESRTVDFVLRRGATITGRVTCGGAPVAFAEVEAFTFAPGWVVILESTDGRADAEGRFRVEGVRAGQVVVFAAAPGDDRWNARNDFLDAVRRNPSFRTDREFQVPKVTEHDVAIERTPRDEGWLERTAREMRKHDRPVRVHGRVTTADGLPLLRARVAVDSRGWGRMGRDFSQPLGADGTYEQEAEFGPDVHTVSVFAWDARHGEAAREKVEIPEGASDVTVDVVLPAREVVRGLVVCDGEPVPGAEVRRGGAVATRTGADGSFSLELSPGEQWLLVTAPGFLAGDPTEFVVPSDNDLVIALERETSIAGTVTDPSGRPIAGVVVTPLSEDGDDAPPGWTGRLREVRLPAKTDAEGRFRVHGVGSGPYRLKLASPAGTAAPIGATTSEPVEGGTTDARLVAVAGMRIAGRVTGPDGAPEVGARIECRPADAPAARERDGLRRAGTGSAGEFGFEGLPPGTWVVEVSPDWDSGLTPARLRIDRETKDLVIALEAAGVVAGRVVLPDGKPFERCDLALERLDKPRADEAKWRDDLTSEWTEDDGTFRIEVPPRSRWRVTFALHANAKSRALLSGGDDVAAGTTDLRLVATPGWRIAGWVRTPNGDPLAKSEVTIVTSDGEKRDARTDDDGRFEIGGMKEQLDGVLTATLDGYVPERRQKVEGGALEVRVFLKKGLSISGRLLTADGKPPQGRQVRALDPQDPDADFWRAQVDDLGRFEIRGLPEGEWPVEAFAPGCMTVTDRAPLGTLRAGASGVELRLPR